MNMPTPYPPPQGPLACYRHPDRAAYVGCTRCGRPLCGECMRTAPVGHQCPECVAAAAASVRPPVTAAGAVVRTGRPVVTYTLIATIVAVFVLQVSLGDMANRFTLWPPAVAGGEYYRLITSTFMHGGLVHLAFNMWALYVLGAPLEEHLGRLRFAALYGLSALGGSVLVYLLSPLNSATVGASGAIFGLFGAYFVAARRLRLDVRWLVTLIVINLVLTFSIPGISWQGHIGGLLTGAGVGAAYIYAPAAKRNLVQGGVSVGLLAVFLALIAWRTSELVGRFGMMLGPGHG